MNNIQKLNLADAFGSFNECWSPRLAGQVNDCAIKLAKLEGDFVWHHHEAEDELFLVVKGTLIMHIRDEKGERAIEIREGELIIIPRGMEHKPKTASGGGEVHVLLVEPSSTLHTGNVVNERTVHELKTLD